MRVLIYEPLPDMNRAPIIAQLAKTLIDDGHDVLTVLEEKLIYTLQGKLTQQGVINCTRTWRRHISIQSQIMIYILKTPLTLYWLVSERNLIDRLRQVTALRREQYAKILHDFDPEKIFVWNGQQEHLQDFMTLARQTHDGRFIYMECGWFPQKGTIYFDTEGVNAASSIARTVRKKLKSREITDLDEWRASYITKPAGSGIQGKIFVPLQVETDTNITIHSPFETMQEFVNFLESWIPERYAATIRPHPLDHSKDGIEIHRANFHFDSQTPIGALIDEAEIVIGINSTVLLEALVRGKKVIALGNGFLVQSSIRESFRSAKINTYETSSGLLHDLKNRQLNTDKIDVHRLGFLQPGKAGQNDTKQRAGLFANSNSALTSKVIAALGKILPENESRG